MASNSSKLDWSWFSRVTGVYRYGPRVFINRFLCRSDVILHPYSNQPKKKCKHAVVVSKMVHRRGAKAAESEGLSLAGERPARERFHSPSGNWVDNGH